MRTIRFIFCIVICFISMQAFSQTDEKVLKEAVEFTLQAIDRTDKKGVEVSNKIDKLSNEMSNEFYVKHESLINETIEFMKEFTSYRSKHREELSNAYKYLKMTLEMYKTPDFKPNEDAIGEVTTTTVIILSKLDDLLNKMDNNMTKIRKLLP
ncbi:hypothetical protein [Bacteroides sp.]|uniref:hypothetical protein n=1 Tax=Bacteroides sp. TaxID=29523 RepID=UPI003A9205DB